MTEKLYDNNSYETEFDALVLKCEKDKNKYKTVLDRTLFFPEEGGQCADKGQLNGIDTTYVELIDGIIYHYSNEPFSEGEKVSGKIDFKLRFRNMQNHSAEHIISGIAHNLYNCNNVGFHLGEDNVTMDLDRPLTKDEIEKIEYLANEAVYKNMPVTAYYPKKEELENISYRSKGEIEEAVRLVKIGDIDCCACCAPHVKNTGEIGIIKILDSMNYKGGARLTIAGGFDALFDYQKKHLSNNEISTMLSVKKDEVLDGVKKLNDTVNTLNIALTKRTKQIADIYKKTLEKTSKNICLFFEDMEMGDLRIIANELKDKTTSFLAVLSGSDGDGYKYIIISEASDVCEFTRTINTSLTTTSSL